MPTDVDALLQRLRPLLLRYTREVEQVTTQLLELDSQNHASELQRHNRELRRQNDDLWRDLRRAEARERQLDQQVRRQGQQLRQRQPREQQRLLEDRYNLRLYELEREYERKHRQLQQQHDHRMEELGTWAETKDQLLQLIYQQAYEIQRLRAAVLDLHQQEVEAWGEAWALGAAEPPEVRSWRYGYGVQTTDCPTSTTAAPVHQPPCARAPASTESTAAATDGLAAAAVDPRCRS